MYVYIYIYIYNLLVDSRRSLGVAEAGQGEDGLAGQGVGYRYRCRYRL